MHWQMRGKHGLHGLMSVPAHGFAAFVVLHDCFNMCITPLDRAWNAHCHPMELPPFKHYCFTIFWICVRLETLSVTFRRYSPSGSPEISTGYEDN